MNKLRNKKLYIAIAIAIAAVIIVGAILLKVYFNRVDNNVTLNTTSNLTVTPTLVVKPSNVQPTPSPEPTIIPTPKPTNTVVPQWPVTYTQNDASSITVVVNKKHKLPSTYVPGLTSFGGVQLRSESAAAITNLVNAASAQGYNLRMISGYRSYSNQSSTYNSYVNRDGQAVADTYSARPGHSEHQTGLAVDVGIGTCDLEICFGDTAAGKWVAANAQNYGFIIRYPNGKQAETGYQYEPWHLRFLGIETAKLVAASGKTLDQYYNVEAGGY